MCFLKIEKEARDEGGSEATVMPVSLRTQWKGLKSRCSHFGEHGCVAVAQALESDVDLWVSHKCIRGVPFIGIGISECAPRRARG